MNDDASTINPDKLAGALEAMQARLHALEASNAELRRQNEAKSAKHVELHPSIVELFAPHLQLRPMEASDRKRILAAYPKSEQLPQPLKDDNGLAAKALGDATGRKWVLTNLAALQKDALEILRAAATGLHVACSAAEPAERLQHLEHTVRDIISLAGDNAQRMARTQLEHIFEAAGTKGARSLLGTDISDNDIDVRDANMLQQAHIDAMQDIRKFHSSVEQARKQAGKGKQQQQRGYGSRGRGGGYRYGGGRRGGGKGGFRTSWRSGGYPNGGRGSGGGSPTTQQ